MRMFVVLAAAAAVAVGARTAADRTDISAWEPTGTDTFRYTVPDAGLGDWAWGEGYRHRWLETWLRENRFCPVGFEIVNRVPVKGTQLGDREVWEGRCKAG